MHSRSKSRGGRRLSVSDFLSRMPHIACGRLSGGGLRTIYLAGVDERITCAFCVGLMSANREVLTEKIPCHTFPGSWTLARQEQAHEKPAVIYNGT
jgi:hypothetical protein